jgi:hypothetical protein
MSARLMWTSSLGEVYCFCVNKAYGSVDTAVELLNM